MGMHQIENSSRLWNSIFVTIPLQQMELNDKTMLESILFHSEQITPQLLPTNLLLDVFPLEKNEFDINIFAEKSIYESPCFSDTYSYELSAM